MQIAVRLLRVDLCPARIVAHREAFCKRQTIGVHMLAPAMARGVVRWKMFANRIPDFAVISL
jgi:hypothetical protein